jgi:high-affinity iron transporter
VETALFLAANAFAADTQGTVIGALLGIAFAIGIGVLIYAYAVRLNMRLFFDTSSILLIIFAAGLAAHGIHEFQEIGWLPILTNPAWNTTWLLTNDSALGSMLRALLGYNAEPSLLEVATYVGYLIIIVQAIRWWTQKISLSLTQKRA